MLIKEIENILNGNKEQRIRLLLEANVYKLKSIELFKNASQSDFLFIKSLFIIPLSLPIEKIQVISNSLNLSLENEIVNISKIEDEQLRESYQWQLLGMAFWHNTFKDIIANHLIENSANWSNLREVASELIRYYSDPSCFTSLEKDHAIYRRAARMGEDESIPSTNRSL